MIEFKKWEELTPKQKQQAKKKYFQYVSRGCIGCGDNIPYSLKRFWERGNFCMPCSTKALTIIDLRKKLETVNKITDKLFGLLEERYGIDKEEFYEKHRKNNLFRHYEKHY